MAFPNLHRSCCRYRKRHRFRANLLKPHDWRFRLQSWHPCTTFILVGIIFFQRSSESAAPRDWSCDAHVGVRNIGIALSGTTMALTNSCESWIFGSRPTGFLRQFTTHIQSLGYCRELGLGVVLFGLFMAYPSGRLFVGITGRSS